MAALARGGRGSSSRAAAAMLVVALALSGAASGDFAADRAECANQLMGLATCLTFVQDKATARAPTPDCCAGLKQVVAASKKCMCVLVKDRDEPALGFKINVTRAMDLPALCNYPATFSDCPKILGMSPDAPEAEIFKEYARKHESQNGTAAIPAAATGMSYISAIPVLTGSNYGEWRTQLNLAFVMTEIEVAISSPLPVEPAAPERGADESAEDFRVRERNHAPERARYDLEKRQWEIANRKCLTIMQTKMAEAIRGSIPTADADEVPYTAAQYLKMVENQFTGSSKAYANTLIKKLVGMKYTGGGVREHILKMSNMNAKLTAMKMVLPEEFLVHLVFASLPQAFSTFEVNYNSMEEKWDFQKLIAMCVQEEERLNASGGGSVNHVQHNNKKRNFPNKNFKPKNQWESGSSQGQNRREGKAPVQQHHDRPQWPIGPNGKKEVPKDVCMYCGQKGHWQMKCPLWLEHMWKNGIPFEPDPAKRRKKN